MNWRAPEIPERFQKLYEKGRAGSSKAAIRCHCLMCVGWEPTEVEQCTATGCPLYTLRNLNAQSQTESADREKRRQRALATGQRPPKRPSADGRGDQPQRHGLNGTGSSPPSPDLQASAMPEDGTSPNADKA